MSGNIAPQIRKELPKMFDNDIRKIRAVLKSLGLEKAKSILTKMSKVVSEMEAEELKSQKEKAEKDAKLNEIVRRLSQEGISTETVIEALARNKSGSGKIKATDARTKVKVKYRLTTENGVVEWTGRGIMKREISKYIADEKAKGLTKAEALKAIAA